jgi:hypothetical protein
MEVGLGPNEGCSVKGKKMTTNYIRMLVLHLPVVRKLGVEVCEGVSSYCSCVKCFSQGN